MMVVPLEAVRERCVGWDEERLRGGRGGVLVCFRVTLVYALSV